jgi:hypothetical protein
MHYGRLFIGVSALSRRGFDREAILIPQSDSFMCLLGLIRREELPARYEFGMNSLGLLTPGRRRRAGWAPLGRSVACQTARDGSQWVATWAMCRGEK